MEHKGNTLMKIEKRNRNRKGREAIREGKGRRVERELWKGMPKERGNSILDKVTD